MTDEKFNPIWITFRVPVKKAEYSACRRSVAGLLSLCRLA